MLLGVLLFFRTMVMDSTQNSGSCIQQMMHQAYRLPKAQGVNEAQGLVHALHFKCISYMLFCCSLNQFC